MEYLLICLVSLIVAALTLFSGFGLGTLLMPAFAFYFPIEIAVAATALVHLANSLFKVVLVGRMADMKTVVRFALPAGMAAMLGAWLLSQFSGIEPLATYQLAGKTFFIEPVKVLLGLLIAFFAAFELIPVFRKFSFPPEYIPLGGALSGFFGGLSGHQGALRSAVLIRADLTKEQFIGTSTVCGVVIDVARISIYGKAFLFVNWRLLEAQGVLGLVGAGSLAALAGSVVGVKLIRKVTFEAVHWIVGFLLLIVAIGLTAGWI